MNKLSWRKFFSRRPSARSRSRRFAAVAGFTLIELMIVITIIFILLGMAAARYDKSVHHAREAALKTDLQVMRQAIDNYTLDKEAGPQSLEDLTNPQAPYLREIPVDPMTHQKDWHTRIRRHRREPRSNHHRHRRRPFQFQRHCRRRHAVQLVVIFRDAAQSTESFAASTF